MMSDEKFRADEEEIPEDVASLYSWANMSASPYRDYSAARARMRELTRLRLEAEQRKAAEEAERASQREAETRVRRTAAAASPVVDSQSVEDVFRPVAAPVRFQDEAPVIEAVRSPRWSAEEPRPVAKPAPVMPEWFHQPVAEPEPEPVAPSPNRYWGVARQMSEPPVLRAESAGGLRVPVLVVFSMVGGVGKTTIAATLGRMLSAAGEQVLLVENSPCGMLHGFYGSTESKPGVLRNFAPPASEHGDAMVQILAIDGSHSLSAAIRHAAGEANRVIVDLSTAALHSLEEILAWNPLILVPVLPETNSTLSVREIEKYFAGKVDAEGEPIRPHYLLNEFDALQPLHQDVRNLLRSKVGDRLMTVTLRRATAVNEALAQGVTVVDYAAGSALVEKFAALASWVRSTSNRVNRNVSGMRWSER